jgi:uncharacterized protein (DUF697 family)
MAITAVMTRLGGGTNRSVKVVGTGGSEPSVTVFAWDASTGIVTSSADSNGVPFFNSAELANLTQTLQQLLGAIAEADALTAEAASIISNALVASAGMPLTGGLPGVTQTITIVGTVVTVSWGRAIANATIYVLLQKPFSTQGGLSLAPPLD